MALQVWLPLNGNLNNQGLFDSTSVNYNATIENNGKIGKCYSFNGTDSHISFTSPINTDNTNFSICCWVKFNSYSTQCIFSIRTSVGKGISLFKISENFRFDAGELTQFSSYNIPINKWIHVTVTKDNQYKKLYINGQLIDTVNSVGNITDMDSIGSIGASQQPGGGFNNFMNGHMNDFRIYDHCLSAKEVSEIAKGMILNYQLKGFGGENLFGFNKGVKIGTIHSNSTVKSNPEEYGYTVNITSNSNAISCRIQNLGFNGQAGESYTFSADIYASSNCQAMFDICDRGVTIFNLTTIKQRYSFSAIPENYYQSNSVYNGFCDIQTVNCSGITIYLSNVKIERGNIATPFCPSISDDIYYKLGYDTNVEYDCSGLNNNGTRSGILNYNSDSARYSGSYNFTESNRIVTPNIPFENIDNGSMSFWIKFNNEFKNQTHYVFFANGFNWTGKGYDFIIVANLGNLSGSATSTSIALDCCSYVTGFTANLNTWYHIVITWDSNYLIKKYVNGELIATNNDTNNKRLDTYKSLHNYHCIGNESSNTSYAGNFNVSDFRIYSTALSQNSIKDLYSSSISIDKNGNLYSYELREG